MADTGFEKGYSNLPIDEYIRMKNRGEREE
jgi:hypothetical protein